MQRRLDAQGMWHPQQAEKLTKQQYNNNDATGVTCRMRNTKLPQPTPGKNAEC